MRYVVVIILSVFRAHVFKSGGPRSRYNALYTRFIVRSEYKFFSLLFDNVYHSIIISNICFNVSLHWALNSKNQFGSLLIKRSIRQYTG